MPEAASVGQTIRRLREDHKYSLQDLAGQSGVSRSWIFRVEDEQIVNPNARMLVSLCGPLEIHPQDLFCAAGYVERDAFHIAAKDMTTTDLLKRINDDLAEIGRRCTTLAEIPRPPR